MMQRSPLRTDDKVERNGAPAAAVGSQQGAQRSFCWTLGYPVAVMVAKHGLAQERKIQPHRPMADIVALERNFRPRLPAADAVGFSDADQTRSGELALWGLG